MIKNKKLSIIYKVVLCVIAIISVILNIGFFTGKPIYRGLTMFTNLSNILCAIYFIIDIIYLIKNYNNKETTFLPSLKGIAMMSITVTFLVAQFVLKMKISFSSSYEISFIGLHYIVPIMTILDWVLFDKKGQIKMYSPLLWCLAPYLYFVSAIMSAQYGSGFGIDSKYPYPFMDIEKLGINRVYLTLMILTLIFILIGYIYYIIDKKLSKKEK